MGHEYESEKRGLSPIYFYLFVLFIYGQAQGESALAGNIEKHGLTPISLREYVLKHYLLLYAVMGETITLLSIRHQRQLSFDFEGHWNE